MKIITIIGARPQFIKASVVSKKLREYHKEILIHTGQHYDKNMSDIFFEELDIPKPDYNLNVGSHSHGRQTGEMLISIEDLIKSEKADGVIVYGDTNSTIAGALVASKLRVPVFHIEAGLRSFDKNMPEEQNRILTDHISTLLFCPTETAVINLKNENINDGVYNVGDVMFDSVLYFYDRALKKYSDNSLFNKFNVKEKEYYLVTTHRAENTDKIKKIQIILQAFNKLDKKVIFPVHPRISSYIEQLRNQNDFSNIIFTEPLGYLEMLFLTKFAKKVLTDSGGLQKETYFLGTPCITMRNSTEWIETLKGNWNVLCELNESDILEKVKDEYVNKDVLNLNFFGDGNASGKIVSMINKYIK